MSRPTRYEPDDPREWLNRAHSNIATAQAIRDADDIYLEDVCFHAQQAAEKAIKAVLVSRGVDFPKTHDIAKLLTLVGDVGVTVPEDIAAAAGLTDYAVLTRYPAHGEPVTDEDCATAIALAHRVVEWGAVLIQPSG